MTQEHSRRRTGEGNRLASCSSDMKTACYRGDRTPLVVVLVYQNVMLFEVAHRRLLNRLKLPIGVY